MPAASRAERPSLRRPARSCRTPCSSGSTATRWRRNSISAREGREGRPLSEVIELLDSAIDALAYAHAQGVVHRDLNPGNFFLAKTPAGTKLKVLDFGVAKVMADSALAMGAAVRTMGNVKNFHARVRRPRAVRRGHRRDRSVDRRLRDCFGDPGGVDGSHRHGGRAHRRAGGQGARPQSPSDAPSIWNPRGRRGGGRAGPGGRPLSGGPTAGRG